MFAIFKLYRYYRRRGASTVGAARIALHVYRNGF